MRVIERPFFSDWAGGMEAEGRAIPSPNADVVCWYHFLYDSIRENVCAAKSCRSSCPWPLINLVVTAWEFLIYIGLILIHEPVGFLVGVADMCPQRITQLCPRDGDGADRFFP